jgi:hypothetical protein
MVAALTRYALTVLYRKKLGQMCQVLDDSLTYEWAGGGQTRSGDFQIADFKPNGGWKAAAVSRACTLSAQKDFLSCRAESRHLSLLASEARIRKQTARDSSTPVGMTESFHQAAAFMSPAASLILPVR